MLGVASGKGDSGQGDKQKGSGFPSNPMLSLVPILCLLSPGSQIGTCSGGSVGTAWGALLVGRRFGHMRNLVSLQDGVVCLQQFHSHIAYLCNHVQLAGKNDSYFASREAEDPMRGLRVGCLRAQCPAH